MTQLTEKEARALLLAMNPWVENPNNLMPEEQFLIITGEYRKNKNNETVPKFQLKTQPDEAGIAAGIVPQPYFRVMVEKKGDGRLGSSGKRSYPYNVFESAQRLLFAAIKKEIVESNYEKEPDSTDGRPIIKLNSPWVGKITIWSVPTYKLRDPNHPAGKFIPWKINRRDRVTGEFKPDTATRNEMPVVMDIDDLKNPVGVALSEFQNNVAPFIKGDIVRIKEVMGVTTEKEVTAAAPTPNEEIPPETKLNEEDLDETTP